MITARITIRTTLSIINFRILRVEGQVIILWLCGSQRVETNRKIFRFRRKNYFLCNILYKFHKILGERNINNSSKEASYIYHI